jgi:hypothetical protein
MSFYEKRKKKWEEEAMDALTLLKWKWLSTRSGETFRWRFK